MSLQVCTQNHAWPAVTVSACTASPLQTTRCRSLADEKQAEQARSLARSHTVTRKRSESAPYRPAALHCGAACD